MAARWIIPLVLIVGVIAEIWVLVLAVGHLGLLVTVGLLVGMALLGGYLWRREGTKAFQSLFEAPPEAGAVGRRVSDAALVMIAGGLLVLPGFISDLLALFCLLPGTRAVARRAVTAMASGFGRSYQNRIDLIDLRMNPGTVVEGEAVVVEDQTPPTGSRPRPDDHLIIRGEIED